jgi:hypothetical protein
MANVLQDYYNRMTALNRQRGMTGNMQYGRALDASIAEGYFDSYEKNKNQSRQLAIMQQNADTAKYSAEQNAKYNQQMMDFRNKAYRTDMMFQGLGMGLTALGTGFKAYNDVQYRNDQLAYQKQFLDAITPKAIEPQYYNGSQLGTPMTGYDMGNWSGQAQITPMNFGELNYDSGLDVGTELGAWVEYL